MSKKKETLLSLSLLFVGFIWGLGFIAVKYAIDAGMNSISINMFRFGIATVLTAIVFHKQVFAIKLVDFKRGILPSVMLALGFFLQNTGMEYTTPGNSALITGSYIILVPFISFLITKIRPSRNALISAVITFVGITILSMPSFSFSDFKIGDLLIFLSAISFAIHFLTLDSALKKVDSSKMTFIQLFFTTILFAIMFFAFDIKNFAKINWDSALLPIVFLGLFSSFLAYCIQTYAQKYIAPTKVAIIMASESLFGAVLSVELMIEPLTWNLVVGGVLALGGIVLAQIPNKPKTESKISQNKNENESFTKEEIKIVTDNMLAMNNLIETENIEQGKTYVNEGLIDDKQDM